MTVTNLVDAADGMQKYQRLVARASLIGTQDYDTFADQPLADAHEGLLLELYPFDLRTVTNRLVSNIVAHQDDPTFYTLFNKFAMQARQSHPVFGIKNWHPQKGAPEWEISIPLVQAIERILKHNKFAHGQLPSMEIADRTIFFLLACQNMSMEPPVFWMVEKYTADLPQVMAKFIKICHKLATYTPEV